MLFQDTKNGAFIVGIDVGFFRKLPKATEEMIEKAKNIINEYCNEEFGHDADFTDYPLVQLGYTEDTLDLTNLFEFELSDKLKCQFMWNI